MVYYSTATSHNNKESSYRNSLIHQSGTMKLHNALQQHEGISDTAHNTGGRMPAPTYAHHRTSDGLPSRPTFHGSMTTTGTSMTTTGTSMTTTGTSMTTTGTSMTTTGTSMTTTGTSAGFVSTDAATLVLHSLTTNCSHFLSTLTTPRRSDTSKHRK
ncbi:hypothetical protein FHG87_011532 [Trinorchestia longiramus]|nr:hypothetical protein FHG87_011532 [Trinorchestia longiramus]